MSDSQNTRAQASITRRDLLKAGARTAAGIAAGAALASLPGVPAVFASSSPSSTTLNFLTGLGGPDGQTMQALVRQFNKEHPGITVKMQTIGTWTTFYSKLLPALTSGNAPEVFTTHVQEMLYFQSKGLFLQVDDLFGPTLPEKDFAPQPMKYVTYQGHIYGMPLDMHGWAFYFNPNLLKAAGLPLRGPASGDEVIQWARKLTVDKHGNNGLSKAFDANNVKVYGIATSWDAPPTFLTTAWSFGADTLTADGKHATFNTPRMQAAVQFWHDLIFKYHACAKPASYGANGPWSAYANKAVAMLPDGDWQRNWFPQHKNVAVKVAFMPRFGSNRVAWMSGHVISCPAGLSGDKKTAAYTFMRWLSEHGLQWTEGAGHIPARISQRTSKAVMGLWPQNVYGPELAEIGRIEHPSTVFFDIQDAYIPQIDAAWNGTKSVSAALSEAQSRVSSALARG